MKPRTMDAHQAIRRGHKRLVTVELWNQVDGLVGELPVEDGEIEYSLSSRDGVRSGRVIVPGYDWFPKVRPEKAAWVRIKFTIENEVWDHGEFPILQVIARRPQGETELILGDWCYRRDTMAESAVTVGSGTIAGTVADWMSHTTPGGSMVLTQDDTNGAAVQSPIEVPLGASIWDALTDLANQAGAVVIITSKSTFQIRRFDPSAPYHDDAAGILLDEVSAVVADEVVNKVVVQAEKANPEGAATVFRAVKTLTTGPYRYARDGIGKWALTETLRLPEPTQALVDAEANRLYERRIGVVRSHRIETVPMPWCEVGDVIVFPSTVFGGPMYGLVDQLRMPLLAKDRMRLTMRDSRIQ